VAAPQRGRGARQDREGAAVVLGARSADALDRVVAEVRADGGVADAVALDLADRASIRAAVDRVEELHGRLDGAFNNGAAIAHQRVDPARPHGRAPRGRRGRRLAAQRPGIDGHRRDRAGRRRCRCLKMIAEIGTTPWRLSVPCWAR
jgi:NAD(P)-dependent dehydrogenase (short-subunit alcohol dehydrogenase family)